MKTATFVVGLSVLVGAVSRILGCGGELWLDEIWSLAHLDDIHSPIDIFSVRHDNNHLLNTLWLWVCGASAPVPLLRLPSLLFSLSMLALIYYQWLKKPGFSTATFVVLCAFSYPLVLYGSEARGYSLTLLCVALTAADGSTLLSKESRAVARRFALWGTVGCFSHAIFLLYIVPISLWLMYRAAFVRDSIPSREITKAATFPPLIASILLVATFYGQLNIGGAPSLPYVQVILSAISTAFGGSELSLYAVPSSAWSALAACGLILLSLLELALWHRERDPRAFFVALILLSPLVAICALQPPFILGRYFLISIVAMYLLSARALSRCARQGLVGTIVSIALVVSYVGLNLRHIGELILNGRGHHLAALTDILRKASSEEESTTIGGNLDFQNKLRLSYASALLPNASTFPYISEYAGHNATPRFLLIESVDRETPVPDIPRQGSFEYRLFNRYHAPLSSGLELFVFERVIKTEAIEPRNK